MTSAATDKQALDKLCIDTIRTLSMDAVQKANSGHPGTPMALAPIAYLLYTRVMHHNPQNADWPDRDRFVLSAGHASMLLYSMLYLTGYGLTLDDIKNFRQVGSPTAGHPEYGHAAGIETTTGPLGQGISNSVGLALGERMLAERFNRPGHQIVDHYTYTIASDGDMQEGVQAEAASIGGHLGLGRLIAFYDDNDISIEGNTDIAFSEDVPARYEAYGWHVQRVDWTNGGKEYVEDVEALWAALQEARAVTDRPSFIAVRTVIAWPAPHAQNTGKAHGAALGEDEVKATKKILGMDPERTFDVPDDVIEHTRGLLERGKRAEAEWQEAFDAWAERYPERKVLYDRMTERRLADGWQEALPTFDADEKGLATRKASGAVLNAIAAELPELWGGSADLAESNNTTPEGEPSFVPADLATKEFPGDEYGRVLHFGIREHGMGSVMNGIALHGGTRVYGGTFLTFSDYMRPAVRLASMMQLPVIYVWTHDSIGLGEDGPTHQPVEHLAALRAIPGLDVVRPADANETVAAWKTVLGRTHCPAGLVLTRQNVPTFPRGTDENGDRWASADETARGGYVLLDAKGGLPDVILIGTGSEVQLAVAARAKLAEEGVDARVVSMPCREWFAEQDEAYRDAVLPPTVKARVSVEAAVAQGWREVVGDAGRIVSLEHWGASADYATIFREFGFTPDAVAQAARDSIHAASHH